jgi:DNA-binding NarL/FixJ family response regulator
MVTMQENPDYLLEAVKAGAAGYVLKGSPNSQIMGAIRRVLEGESPLNQELAMHVIHRLASESKQEPVVPEQEAESSPDPEVRRHPDPLLHSLTERELEILRLVAKGKTNQQIAKNLVISTLTVKTHVQRIIGKLGVSDRTQAAVRAAEHGLLASDSPR